MTITETVTRATPTTTTTSTLPLLPLEAHLLPPFTQQQQHPTVLKEQFLTLKEVVHGRWTWLHSPLTAHLTLVAKIAPSLRSRMRPRWIPRPRRMVKKYVSFLFQRYSTRSSNHKQDQKKLFLFWTEVDKGRSLPFHWHNGLSISLFPFISYSLGGVYALCFLLHNRVSTRRRR